MTVITRFAPSPTGFLHIGGARTALFNWVFARHHAGKMLLRIEDTDRARSTEAAVGAIYDGLKWLGITWDGEAVSQFSRAGRHAEVARQLLAEGKAYHCYATPEELAAMREKARAEKRSFTYDGTWRDRHPSEAPAGIAPTIRIKAPREGETVIQDKVQGEVRVRNADLDDMILLRSDGTPTYMLAVVVDDHDMNVSHVIRGDDHFTNTFRQAQIYHAMGWPLPEFAHIPLIHGADGAKLSKRHGALGVDAYRDMGYLPEAMVNYLMRLGWGHGDDEIFTIEQVIEWFDLANVGKSPARFDFDKLNALNSHYLKQRPNSDLAAMIRPDIEKRLGRELTEIEVERLEPALTALKDRAKLLPELVENSLFYFSAVPLVMSEKAAGQLDEQSRHNLAEVAGLLSDLDGWEEQDLSDTVKAYAEASDLKLGKIAQPLRAALTGSTVSPGIFEVLAVLGREESLRRIEAAAKAQFTPVDSQGS